MSFAFGLLLVVFVLASVLRVPIALGMLASGVAYLFASKQDVGLAAEQLLNTLYNSYALLAIPMFVLAANVMNAGTISDRLFAAADAFVGRFRGGLAHVTVVVTTVFASMSGSAVTDAAGPGMVAIRMMRQAGYRGGYAAALTAAASTIAPIIPPSIPMVMYSLLTGASVGALFVGGVVPGLLMSVSLMGMIIVTAKRQGLPIGKALRRAEVLQAIRRSLLPLTLPAVLLGGILSGVFTPTEAAAAAAFYALILAGLVYRSLGWKALFAVFAESMRQSAVVMLLIAGAFIVNYAVTTEGIAALLAAWIRSQQFTPLQFMLMVNAVFLVLGCLLDTGVLLLVILPLLIPTVKVLGIDLVYFGVVSVVNFMIGLITPPYGLLLFVLATLTGVPLRDIMREVWKFVVPLVGVLMLLVFFPQLVMWLPALAGYGR